MIDLDLLADKVERIIADRNHGDLCGCVAWLNDECKYVKRNQHFCTSVLATLEIAFPMIMEALKNDNTG